MIKSYDVGSLPFTGNNKKFNIGANSYVQSPPKKKSASIKYFEAEVVESFLDKIRAGINVPNYPQFRSMTERFLDLFEGVNKVKGGYTESGFLTVKKNNGLPEVAVIRGNSKKILERIGFPFQLKISVTGPYTLSCLFINRDDNIFSRLGNVISQIVENSVFKGKSGEVALVAVDEPTFGQIDDPLIDVGTEGRKNLLSAWEAIFYKAASKGVDTCLHLHNTTDNLFWDVKSLKVVESHVEDFIYQSERTKKRLESTDKFLKASISISNFDALIREKLKLSLNQDTGETALNEKIAETWRKTDSEKMDPITFLESLDLMKKRLSKTINKFGIERVPYAGPECGLKSFPNYNCALESLRRVAKAIKDKHH